MKNKIELYIIAILLTAVLVLPTLATVPGIGTGVGATISNPHAADAMWVEVTPGSGTVSTTTAETAVGSYFNITVAMNITENVFAYQIALLYNRTWLRCSRAGYTLVNGGPSQFMSGHATSAATPTIDTSFLGNGSILASEACLGSDNVTGPHSGTLVWMEFQIMLAPNKGQSFLSAFDITTKTPSKNWVEDPNLVILTVTPYNGNITYAWSAPLTKPFMGIEHDNGFGPYLPIAVGADVWPLQWSQFAPGIGIMANMTSGFNALIYVKQIDPAWYMQNVTFTLTWNSTVIDILGGMANVTVDPAWTVVSSSCVPGQLVLDLSSFSGSVPPLNNKVLVATAVFTVITQGTVPPYPSGYADSTDLTFSNVVVADHTLLITTATPEKGHVDVFSVATLKLPYLYVSPATTIIGPNPSLGTIICISIKVANLTTNWHDVAIQTRLTYDDTLFSLVSVTEGPFMTKPLWDLHGTFFYTVDEIGGDILFPMTHIQLLDLLLPNGSGQYDQTVFPNTIETAGVDPTLATFCFQVLQQNCFGLPNITSQFDILPFWYPSDKTFIDNNAQYIPSLPGVNGTVIIASLNFVGRQIDVYGGAVNDGYGILVGTYPHFPFPYDGEGPNNPMDLVYPQSFVYLHANVTYNYWPVQCKDVGFEIEGPYTHLANGSYVPATGGVFDYLFGGNPLKFAATTDTSGVASYGFRMPWVCPVQFTDDQLTGVYKITSSVTIADQVVMDTMYFYYQRLVYITSVTTDQYTYNHEQCVKVTVNYETHSIQKYPALFSVVITDDLNVPIGTALYNTMVGGAVFCTWKTSYFNVTICIPKWAYAGNGYVHVSVFDKDPTIGGEALAPEFTPDPQINITPY